MKRPYVEELTRELEATLGGARMPPEIGNVIVPDVVVCATRAPPPACFCGALS